MGRVFFVVADSGEILEGVRSSLLSDYAVVKAKKDVLLKNRKKRKQAVLDMLQDTAAGVGTSTVGTSTAGMPTVSIPNDRDYTVMDYLKNE